MFWWFQKCKECKHLCTVSSVKMVHVQKETCILETKSLRTKYTNTTKNSLLLQGDAREQILVVNHFRFGEIISFFYCCCIMWPSAQSGNNKQPMIAAKRIWKSSRKYDWRAIFCFTGILHISRCPKQSQHCALGHTYQQHWKKKIIKKAHF